MVWLKIRYARSRWNKILWPFSRFAFGWDVYTTSQAITEPLLPPWEKRMEEREELFADSRDWGPRLESSHSKCADHASEQKQRQHRQDSRSISSPVQNMTASLVQQQPAPIQQGLRCWYHHDSCHNYRDYVLSGIL